MSQSQELRSLKQAVWGLILGACLGLTGCMGNYSGQNLPTGYYLSSQVQYFPAGPEFKLTREAAAQKEYRDTQAEREGLAQQQ